MNDRPEGAIKEEERCEVIATDIGRCDRPRGHTGFHSFLVTAPVSTPIEER